jgi:cysteine desulfurase
MFLKITKPKKNIYLDYAASTPLDLSVKKVMAPFWNEKFGNPSALYKEGKEAKTALDKARSNISNLIRAKQSEIIFTAGGTESVNLAIFGLARKFPLFSKEGARGSLDAHFITSSIEHHCVLNSFKALEGEGYKTTLVGVNKEGFVNIDQLEKSVSPQTVFISIMLANNEIGTIEPIAEIGKWLRALNQERIKKGLPKIIFHTDACQAAGFLDLNVDRLGIDLMSVNGSKIYGPKQTGFLYVRSGVILKPLVYGGGQEKELRSGTENVAGAVGLAKAFELAQASRLKENVKLINLRDYLITRLQKTIPGMLLNGPADNKLKDRLPNNVNFTIKGVEGESLMLYLDSYGISAATSSACTAASVEPSHVLVAIGHSAKDAKSSIRFSLGKATTKAEIDYVIKVLPQTVKELKKVKGL